MMTFTQFAFNNVRRNTRQYLSYFLSCTFAVTIFFMYAAVIFHPDIAGNEFRENVQRGIIASEVIIYCFSFLFVLYSTGAFIKSRMKEYGLLTTLGISKGQLRRMLLLENTLIGLVSIGAGLLLGTLLLTLFLMVFAAILGTGDTLPFHLPWQAVVLTAGLFFVMFEFNTLAVIWTIRTNSIMDVFRGAKKPKKVPGFSWIVSLLALAAIGGAYYLAYTADLTSIFYRMFLILFLVIPGTYFLFTQFSVALISLLKKNKRFYFKGSNLLTMSDLSYKMKDNARLLFFVTILSAVSFTSSGVLYGLFQGIEEEAERFLPQDVTLIGQDNTGAKSFKQEINNVEQQFSKNDIPFESFQTQAVKVKAESDLNDWNDTVFSLYSYSDYKRLTALQGKKVDFQIQSGQAVMLMQDVTLRFTRDLPKELTIQTANKKISTSIDVKETLLNANLYFNMSIIVPEDVYTDFLKTAKDTESFHYYSMNIPNWPAHAEEITEILAYVDREIAYPDSSASFYMTNKEAFSYTFFFGIFISVLFFLAAGSILYFRMYQNIDKDLEHFHSLYRIGFTDQEMKRIATTQLGLMFLIPFVVAVIHAGFAFKALQNMLVSSVLLPSVMIISLYFIIQLINFIVIRNIYTAKIKKVM
ncbi:FtsX-like permease family protein [Virgibacillus doumboii]|uniref:FtsX-like permease family protein n=1 Tax=Virgibacillus doumboii TaxID=2697503 RepID=UPI001FE8AAD3|nr:FtsX-like permease family protein [Virgibacillus doumboii]